MSRFEEMRINTKIAIEGLEFVNEEVSEESVSQRLSLSSTNRMGSSPMKDTQSYLQV